MKKFILLIDSGNDKLDLFANAMAQTEIDLSYDCIVVRNSEMAMKVLKRIVPDFIFVNVDSSGICLKTCLSRIRELELLHNMQVYLLGGANYLRPLYALYPLHVGMHIKENITVDLLVKLLLHDFVAEGTVHVVCSN